MICWFSGCGNSRFVAETLASLLDERLVSIPEALRQGSCRLDLAPGERLGFVWPVYCWAPPPIVLDFVSRMSVSGSASHVFFVATCGDNAGLAEQVFRRALRRRGLQLDSAYTVVMPETYVNLKGMGLDTPEGAKSKVEAARRLLPEIAGSIRSGERCSRVVKGGSAWSKTYLVRPFFNAFLVTDKPFRVSEECTGCGLCACLCPVRNISIKDGKPIWNGNCLTCNSCYHHCPAHAISFGKATEGKGQYYFGKYD